MTTKIRSKPRPEAPGSWRNPSTAILVGVDRRLPDRAGTWAALTPILGRSPFERHLVHLSKLGVRTFVLPVSAEVIDNVRSICRKQAEPLLPDGAEVLFEPYDGGEAPVTGEGTLLLVRADSVYDPRLYRAVTEAPGPTQLCDGTVSEEPGEALEPTDTSRMVGIVKLRIGTDATSRLPCLPLDDIEPYLPEMRRRLRPYWCAIEREHDVDRAARMILDSAQKGVLDFPARYLHPWPENLLTRLLAPTRVTPNMITFLTAVTGFGATYLFAVGSFAWGLWFAFLTNVLDGVDGKLARVKLLSSPLGHRFDHTLDVSYEFSWYLALGWGLSVHSADRGPLLTGLALVAVMLGTRAVSGLYTMASGRQIHDHRAFDRAFRLVAGRRNIYMLVFLGGLLMGRLAQALSVCLVWALATLGVYLVRAAMAGVQRKRVRTRSR